MATGKQKLLSKMSGPPPMPTPRGQATSQDDYGNPVSSKSPIEIMFPAKPGARETKHNMAGRFKPGDNAKRKARARKRGY